MRKEIKIFGILLIASLLIASSSSQSYYRLYKHWGRPDAKCIDGSSSALYISEGVSDKILIYFEGGGMCAGMNLADTLQNCYQRSRTSLGSSNGYIQSRDFNEFTVLSNDESINPLYARWTKVYVPYCDGVLHQGSRNLSIEYKGTQLYLRGMENTRAHFAYLDETYSLFSASEIVLTGTSAGAMAALGWSNVVYKKMQNPKGLLVLFDSGQFVSDYYNPITNSTPGIDAFKSIKNLAFTQQQPPFQECLRMQSRQNCDKFGILINYILPPVFAIESQYDLYAINNILLLRCPQKSFPASLQKCNGTQMSIIEDYRRKSLDALRNLTNHDKNGLWAIACSQHGFLYNSYMYNSNAYKVPKQTGTTVLTALQNFLSGRGPKINIDIIAWPHNQPCSGYSNLITSSQ